MQSFNSKAQVSSCLLFTTGDQGMQIKDRYKHLCCPECGKVDEVAAVTEGVDYSASNLQGAPMVTTYDHFRVVDEAAKQLLESVFSNEVVFQSLGQGSPLYVAHPQKIIRAPADHHIYERGEDLKEGDMFRPEVGVCPNCKRFYSVAVKPFFFSLDQQDALVGLEAETGRHRSLLWVTNDQKAQELKVKGDAYIRWIPSAMLVKRPPR